MSQFEHLGFVETIARLDKSRPQIRNQKSQIGLPASARGLNWCLPSTWMSNLKFRDFGFEMGFCPISRFPPLVFSVTKVKLKLRHYRRCR